MYGHALNANVSMLLCSQSQHKHAYVKWILYITGQAAKGNINLSIF